MAITAAQLLVKVSADTKGAEEGLGKVNSKAKESSGFLKNTLSTMAGFVGGTLIMKGVGDAVSLVRDNLSDMVQSGMDANREMNILAQGLRSTHDASGMTVQGLDDLSTKIMNLTGIDDDSTKAAEQMLLTFTGIGRDVFPQATQAAADMATRMNGGAIPSAQQMQNVALQLGKALNDPATGMMMLRREGVTFSAEQQKQIKTMEAAGNTAGAQAVMLKELNKEFGGSARAAGEANGGIAIMSARLDNMKQSIGQAIIPVLTRMLKAIQPLVNAFADWFPGAVSTALSLVQPPLSTIGGLVGDLAAAFKQMSEPVHKAFTTLYKPLQTTSDLFRGVYNHVQPVKKTFQDLYQPLHTTSDLFRGAVKPVQETSKAIKEANAKFQEAGRQQQLAEFLGKLRDLFTTVGKVVVTDVIPMLRRLGDWLLTVGVPAFNQMADFIKTSVVPTLKQIGEFVISTVLPALGQLATWVITQVVPALQQLFKWFSAHVLPIIEQLVKIVIADVLPALESIAGTVMHKLVPALERLWNKISPVLIPAFQLIGGILKNVVAPAFDKAITGVSNLIDVISTIIGKIGDFLGILGKVKDGIGHAFSGLKNVPVIGGLIPHFASGGIMGNQGIAVVGEAGPELVKLPAGAQVYSASQTAGMFSHAAPMVGRSAQPVVINVHVAGQHVAQTLLPDIVNELRHGTGVREF